MAIMFVNMTIMPGPGHRRSSLSVSCNQECYHHYEGINPLTACDSHCTAAHTDFTSDDPGLGPTIRGLISSDSYPMIATLSRA